MPTGVTTTGPSSMPKRNRCCCGERQPFPVSVVMTWSLSVFTTQRIHNTTQLHSCTHTHTNTRTLTHTRTHTHTHTHKLLFDHLRDGPCSFYQRGVAGAAAAAASVSPH